MDFVVLYNSIDESTTWISTNVVVNSRVTLKAYAQGATLKTLKSMEIEVTMQEF